MVEVTDGKQRGNDSGSTPETNSTDKRNYCTNYTAESTNEIIWVKCTWIYPFVVRPNEAWASGSRFSSWRSDSWNMWTICMMITFPWTSDRVWPAGSSLRIGESCSMGAQCTLKSIDLWDESNRLVNLNVWMMSLNSLYVVSYQILSMWIYPQPEISLQWHPLVYNTILRQLAQTNRLTEFSKPRAEGLKQT